MVRVALAVVVVAAIAAGAYALGAARDDGHALKRVVVANTTDDDPTPDKWVTAECPDGMTVISGGANVPHGHDTPGVALYQSGPYTDGDVNGWWASAQDTAKGRRPWLLQVQAICSDGVQTRDVGASSLPPEVYSPAG